ncbi:restriction endonuclease subunit S [Streptomyces sp. NBRC 110465]|uniref:restriction endonuclease subunit S n=1 Tax=Streptomyces sp. NBRC 110465 TaxID=1897621 RepID=UPI0015BD098D|nr:restriction endonuclease subunit S [Streptomyces sp. NBRC 110465]
MSVLHESKVKNVGLAERNLLSLSFGRIIRKNIDAVGGLLPESFETYQIVERNHLVFRFTDLQNDQRSLRSARVIERGIITSAYVSARPTGIDARYVEHLMRSYDLTKVFYGLGGGVRQSLKFSDIARLPVILPPAEEQRAIADYLDRETARIDTLIEEQQRLIEMLRERRFALRVRVALHGTAQTEEVESPLPWAKKLPAHWRVVPLTSVAELESGHTPSRSREDWWQDCYIPWVSLHDVGMMRGAKYLHDTAQCISDAGIANSSARLLPARTVVLSRDATVGRAAIMGVPMATSQHFAAWVCGPDLDPEYLWVLFEDAMQPFFDSFQNGSTIRTIGMGDLKAFRIPLPPLDEQRRIVECLDEETSKIDMLIEEAARFIELSKERRSALITGAVTGQIDVREAA